MTTIGTPSAPPMLGDQDTDADLTCDDELMDVTQESEDSSDQPEEEMEVGDGEGELINEETPSAGSVSPKPATAPKPVPTEPEVITLGDSDEDDEGPRPYAGSQHRGRETTSPSSGKGGEESAAESTPSRTWAPSLHRGTEPNSPNFNDEEVDSDADTPPQPTSSTPEVPMMEEQPHENQTPGSRNVSISAVWVPPTVDQITAPEEEAENDESASHDSELTPSRDETPEIAEVTERAESLSVSPSFEDEMDAESIATPPPPEPIQVPEPPKIATVASLTTKLGEAVKKMNLNGPALKALLKKQTQKPAITTQNEDLVPKVRKIFDLSTNFDVNEFCQRTGCHPADHRFMFFNNKVAFSPVCQAVFIKGMVLEVDRGNDIEKGKVKNNINGEVLLGTAKGDLITANPWEVTCREVFDEGWAKYAGESFFDYIEDVKPREKCNEPLYTFIKKGQFFELIDEENPRQVHIVVVTKNACGFLDVMAINQSKHTVHMADVRCQPIGFAEMHPEDFALAPGSVLPSRSQYVPAFCFGVDPFGHPASPKGLTPLLTLTLSLCQHRFEIGHLLTSIDPEANPRLIPSFVSKIINSYFFEITLIEDFEKPMEEWTTRVAWASAMFIFPFAHANKEKVGMTLPKGLTGYDKLTVEELNKIIPVELKNPPTTRFALPSSENPVTSFLWDDEGEETAEVKNKLQRNLLEVAEDGLKDAVHLGRVVRVTKHFIFVSLESFNEFMPPRMFRYSDPKLLPLGTAKQCGWNTVIPAMTKAGPVKKPNTDHLTGNPVEAVANSKLSYVPPYVLSERKYCPKIYVNKSCFHGPFIEDNRVWRFSNVYGDGPLDRVLEDLVSDFSQTCRHTRILSLIDSKNMTDVVEQRAKYYSTSGPNDRQHSGNCTLFSFVTCTSTDRLNYWLNILCRTIDACPGFLSVSPRDPAKPCEFGCDTASTKYASLMLPKVHVNTAYSNYAHTEKAKHTLRKKRKTIVQQLKEMAPKRPRIDNGKVYMDSDDEDRASGDEDAESVDVDAPRQLRARPARVPSPVVERPVRNRPTITRRPVVREPSSDVESEDEPIEDLNENERPSPVDFQLVDEDSDIEILSSTDSGPTSSPSSRQNSIQPQASQRIFRPAMSNLPPNVITMNRPPPRPTAPIARPHLVDMEESYRANPTPPPGLRPIRRMMPQPQRIQMPNYQRGQYGPILTAERRSSFRPPPNPNGDNHFTSMRNGGAKIRLPINEYQRTPVVRLTNPLQGYRQYPSREGAALPARPQEWRSPNPSERISINRMGGITASTYQRLEGQSRQQTHPEGLRPVQQARPVLGGERRLPPNVQIASSSEQNSPNTRPREAMINGSRYTYVPLNETSRTFSIRQKPDTGGVSRPILGSTTPSASPQLPRNVTVAPATAQQLPRVTAMATAPPQLSRAVTTTPTAPPQLVRATTSTPTAPPQLSRAVTTTPTAPPMLSRAATTTPTAQSQLPRLSASTAPPQLQSEATSSTASEPLRYDPVSNRYVTGYSLNSLQTTGSATIVTPPQAVPLRVQRQEVPSPREQPSSSTQPPVIFARNSSNNILNLNNSNGRVYQQNRASLTPNPLSITRPTAQHRPRSRGLTADYVYKPRPQTQGPRSRPQTPVTPLSTDGPTPASRSQSATEAAPPPSPRGSVPSHVQKKDELLSQLRNMSNEQVVEPVPTSSVPRPSPASVPSTSASSSSAPRPAPTPPKSSEKPVVVTSDPKTWSCTELADYINEYFGDPTLSSFIVASRINGARFMGMDKSALTTIGYKLGPALKIHKLAMDLRKLSADYEKKAK
uniref:SLED domain-containing protein n=1 Tax=Panagrellus redivivus TaxID=6233 RepID=A0A7E4VK40_PANRE